MMLPYLEEVQGCEYEATDARTPMPSSTKVYPSRVIREELRTQNQNIHQKTSSLPGSSKIEPDRREVLKIRIDICMKTLSKCLTM
jgi:hypothetical protein